MSRSAVLSASALAAASMMAGLAAAEEVDGPPLMQNAITWVARASSTSEVLTLNLTNLLILLVLKALIFGFGLVSVGGIGRSMSEDTTSPVTQTDLTGGMYFLMYTSGDESKFEGLLRSACDDPWVAEDYLTAAKMWYKLHNLLKSVVPFEDKYSKIMHGVKEAIEYGKTGEQCHLKYHW